MVPRRQQGGAGRKRIDTTKLIEDKAARQVAFSKRRVTLFSMASDLSALCGVDTAIVVFSPSPRGNVYAFGSPSVDAVLRRLDPTSPKDDIALPVEEEEDATSLAALRQVLADTKAPVEAEKARIKAFNASMERAMAASKTTKLWEVDVNMLGAAELPMFVAELRRNRDAVHRHIDSLHAAGQNGALLTVPVDAAACSLSQQLASGHAMNHGDA